MVLKVLQLKRLKTNILWEWFKSIINLNQHYSGDIYLEDVFVPDNNRLEKATDFATGTGVALEFSRL